MMQDKVLGAGESSGVLMISGYCDICIQGLTSGQVVLQYMLSPTVEYPSPTWVNFPSGSFTEDIYKTVFISEGGIRCRLTGVGNNAGVYVRLGKSSGNQ